MPSWVFQVGRRTGWNNSCWTLCWCVLLVSTLLLAERGLRKQLCEPLSTPQVFLLQSTDLNGCPGCHRGLFPPFRRSP